MKLVIDIPEDMYNDANILMVKDLPELKKIIANGTPLQTVTNAEEAEAYPITENITISKEELQELIHTLELGRPAFDGEDINYDV